MTKISLTLTALAMAGTFAIAGSAPAQRRDVEVTHTTVVQHEEHRSGWNNDRHRVCKVRWQGHRRVRRCWTR